MYIYSYSAEIVATHRWKRWITAPSPWRQTTGSQRTFSTLPTLLVTLVILLVAGTATGQAFPPVNRPVFSKAEKKEFQIRQDSLKVLSNQLVFAEDPAIRLRSDSQFIKTLVRALKLKNSFFFPFDSLLPISRIYAPDSTFRIMTWQYKKDEHLYLQEGAIQVRQPDGSLKLFPLFDASMFTGKPTDSVRSNRNWIGAVYYRIIEKTYNGQNFYTLLGFDDYSLESNKKWMEVLHFNEDQEPLFGGPFISFREDTAQRQGHARFNIEYKKEAVTTFNYDPAMDMIIYDHLIPEDDDTLRLDTYIPDGDYEGFKWKNGAWVHVEKVFHYKLKDGDFPQDEKILDESGNANEEKLMEQTQKNLQKKKKPSTQ
ncbi:MAG: hypothetical protein P4L51_20980 [Puia sp.]|nr:hypothetical protein [Puia sp.]